MKRPAMKSRRETTNVLSEKPNKLYYQEAPDTLGMMDLTPQAFGVALDSNRVMLAKALRVGPSAVNTYVAGNQYEDRLPGALLGQGRPYVVMFPSAIDNLARLFIAILASLFPLAPNNYTHLCQQSDISLSDHLLICTGICMAVFMNAFVSWILNSTII